MLPLSAAAGPASAFDSTPGTPSPRRFAADLSVEVEPTSFAGGFLDYIVAVENEGPDAAAEVMLRDTLPAGSLSDISISAPGLAPSACRRAGPRTVRCHLGPLPRREYATIVISARATREGTYVNTARVESRTYDPRPKNNADRATIRVGAPRRERSGQAPR